MISILLLIMTVPPPFEISLISHSFQEFTALLQCKLNWIGILFAIHCRISSSIQYEMPFVVFNQKFPIFAQGIRRQGHSLLLLLLLTHTLSSLFRRTFPVCIYIKIFMVYNNGERNVVVFSANNRICKDIPDIRSILIHQKQVMINYSVLTLSLSIREVISRERERIA